MDEQDEYPPLLRHRLGFRDAKNTFQTPMCAVFNTQRLHIILPVYALLRVLPSFLKDEKIFKWYCYL